MDKINFTGGYLLKQPAQKLLEKFNNEIMPKRKRIIIPNIPRKGDYFFVIKDCYDKEVAEYLLKKPFNFIYYPEITLKSRLNSQKPQEAKKYIAAQTNMLKKTKEIEKYISELRPSPKPINYYWTPNDHIEPTVKYLRINPNEYDITTTNHITKIRIKDNGNLLATISPKNHEGSHIAYIFPRYGDEDFKIVKFDYTNKIVIEDTNISNLPKYDEQFNKAVQIDKGRILPSNSDA